MSGNGNGATRHGLQDDEPQVDAPPSTAQYAYEVRCKICRWGKSNPDLVELIHERHYRDHASYRDIMEDVNALIEQEALDVEPLTLSNFTAHFTRHVSPDQALIYELQQRGGQRPSTRPNDVFQKILKAKQETLVKLQNNAARWQRVIDKAFAEMGFDKKNQDGSPAPEPKLGPADVRVMKDATVSLATLIRTMGAYIHDHAVVLSILDYTVQNYARRLSERFGYGLQRLRDEAQQSGRYDEQQWKAFEGVLKESINELFYEVRKDSITHFGLTDPGESKKEG
jgi:hypothetical protein